VPDNSQDRQSLRDLDGVRVSIDPLSPDLKARGLSEEALRKTVEGQLERDGITVLNAGTFPVGDPFLSVRISASAENSGLIGFGVEVNFLQIVFMRRNPAVTFNRGCTWSADGGVHLVSPAGLRKSISEQISKQVAEFIAAYRSVNPK